ncbi:MAG: Hint domain-containing protein, partial [Planctomycetales bacterium]|nr:Hint domain-containing protein [Planctomycetales bacterium]
LEAPPEPGSDFELDISNGSWPAIGLSLRDEFTTTVERDYGARTQNVDYSNLEEAKNIINSAVEQQTRGRIKDLFEVLDPGTVTVLTNSIYFKAQWDVQFKPESTAVSQFVRDDGTTVDVPMMFADSNSIDPNSRASIQTRHTELAGFQVLDIPFENERSSMVILMPIDASGSNELTPDVLANVNDWMESPRLHTCVNATIPKFNVTVTTPLADLLPEMGMPTPFGNADFSRMVEGGGIWIGQAPHKAFIEINEQGAEAAAATAVEFVLCFAAGTPVQTPDGEVPIEELRVGDLVVSRSEHHSNGRIQHKRIEELFHGFGEIVELHVGGQVIRVTKEHRFYVEDKGWLPVSEMVPGHRLATDLTSWKVVEDIVETGKAVPVYNFRVADHHTYFVGGNEWDFAVWTHNCYGDNFDFRADRPFHYLVRDNENGSLLFMGRVSDPTQSTNELDPTITPGDKVPGDSNGDGRFTSADLVAVFQAAKYETGASATFAEGDWNGDGIFNTRDLVFAFQNTVYERPAAIPIAAIDQLDAVFESADDRRVIKHSPKDNWPAVTDTSLIADAR